jgi:hypothetical protein
MQTRAQAAFERTNMVLRSATTNPSTIKAVYRKGLRGQLDRATAAVGTGLMGASQILCKRVLLNPGTMRSSNWMVKRFRAAFQSRSGIDHFLLMLFARYAARPSTNSAHESAGETSWS